MSQRCRYFEIYNYRPFIYDLMKKDRNFRWLSAPKPTMSDKMYNLEFWYNMDDKQRNDLYNATFETSLNEEEMAFDAADIIKCGKDLFLRKSQTANNLSLWWLRSNFPEFRIHLTHHFNDYTRHNDCELIPLRPPTSGSEGIVLMNVT